jgi:hypothetical protein
MVIFNSYDKLPEGNHEGFIVEFSWFFPSLHPGVPYDFSGTSSQDVSSESAHQKKHGQIPNDDPQQAGIALKRMV